LALLELRDVEARYGPVRALHGVSLEVGEGELVSVLGANGAGKTTTLRAISGTVRTSGDVVLDGKRVTRLGPEAMARRGVAHVPEGRGTFATLSVLDNLRLGGWTRRGIADELRRVYAFFPRLEERRDQQAGTLSGGEQQMLALGRALMARPRLLLLDEPSLGLAPMVVREIFDALARMNVEHGTAIVVVEQNAVLALRHATRAYVLETGRVALGGPAEELRADESVRRSYLGY
jgi:branched-chain amino acid transport system ATP-binding protein